jgi:UDPglucose--hexose-1-phosphate uridylyltransferase
MTRFDFDAALQTRPHRRLNALTGEWVFVSPQRTQRPWHGEQTVPGRTQLESYDPACYLCPGNLRANGDLNPRYNGTHVFPNDFPAFRRNGALEQIGPSDLLQAETHAGVCRVICYSPRHDLSLAQMPVEQIRRVVDTWAAQALELSGDWRWVQIFENKGEIMGCSNPHPHGQVWAGDFIPNEAEKELVQQRIWLKVHGRALLIDYAEAEVVKGERVIVSNSHWLALVPWWAVWPFETLLLPRRAVASLHGLLMDEREALAEVLSALLRAYDRLFKVSFPYSFGWHGAPGKCAPGEEAQGWQLHAHFYPPLLRSASVKKFMVGYEMLAETQRDITPEQAADQLRACVE